MHASEPCETTQAGRMPVGSAEPGAERPLHACPAFRLGPIGLRVIGHPGFVEWERAGRQLFGLGNAVAWAVGDWLIYGSGRGAWGESYARAVDLTKRSYGSLAQSGRVSRAFPVEARFKNLSWSHHQAALGVGPEHRRSFLQRAEAEHWTRDDLRAAVREANAHPPTSTTLVAPDPDRARSGPANEPGMRPEPRRPTQDVLSSPAVAILCRLHDAGLNLEILDGRLTVRPVDKQTLDQRRVIRRHEDELTALVRICDEGVQERLGVLKQRLQEAPEGTAPDLEFRRGAAYTTAVCFSCGAPLGHPEHGRCWRCSLALRMAVGLPIPADGAAISDEARVVT